MTKREYSVYLYRCFSFMQYTRQWYNFQSEDLCSLIFLNILSDGKEITKESFGMYIKPAHNQMVREFFNTHPIEAQRRNDRRKKRYYDNRDIEMKRARDNYYKKRVELLEKWQKGKAELSDYYIKKLIHGNGGKKISKIRESDIIQVRQSILLGERYQGCNLAKQSGKKHYKFNGYIVTPFGKFESTYAAAKHIGISASGIFNRIRSENFTDYFREGK